MAVKACLLRGISYIKCSMTFVNIAVAISALAAGGQKQFRTETTGWWCFRDFSTIFGCLSLRGYWHGILGHFGRLLAMEKPAKSEKNSVNSDILKGFKGIGNIVKYDVLGRFYGDKWNYRALKETVAKSCNHIQKTRDLVDFVENKCRERCKMFMDSFSGRRRRGYFKFPSLGSPHGVEKWKKHPLEGHPGERIVAIR